MSFHSPVGNSVSSVGYRLLKPLNVIYSEVKQVFWQQLKLIYEFFYKQKQYLRVKIYWYWTNKHE